MTTNHRRTALITGGANGIGLELSRLIAADGYDPVLVDINEVAMERAETLIESETGRKVMKISKDLSLPTAAAEIHEEVMSERGEISLLVNNAGFGLAGRFVDLSLEEQLKMLQVNITAVVALTSYFLPELLKEECAGILNLASIAAFSAGPYMSTYFASKAFVLSFSEALARELSGTGVTVTSVCPPPTDTGFAARAGAQRSFAFKQGVMMNSQAVAKEAYSGLKNGREVVVPGVPFKFVALASRFVPRGTAANFAGMLNKARVDQTEVAEAV